MRPIALVSCLLAFAFACASCGGAPTPVSPTTTTAAVGSDGGSPSGGSATGTGSTAGTPVGLSGLVRGLTAADATFSLVTRAGTRTIVTDSATQVWSAGTQVRLSTLRDGQAVSIRGDDHTRYVLARTIAVN